MAKKTGEESLKIKTAIKSFFRTRNCFNAVEGNKGQYHRLIEYVQQATPIKTVFNKNVSGPILCSMIQTYVSRLQKKAPAVIQSAFNRAVAAESRKAIEKLYVKYLESMGEVEEKIPCSEEELQDYHVKLSGDLLRVFDEQMADFCECEEIVSEKNTIVQRMNGYYEDLKESNLRHSEEMCKSMFKKLFEMCRLDDEINEKITDIEGMMIGNINVYYENARGPAAYRVFMEEIVEIFPFFCGIIRDISQQIENSNDELTQEVENLKKNREKARQNEKKLQGLLEETIKNYESQLEAKEKTISELQINCNTRINISENKAKNLARELKMVQQELEQAQKEKEAALEIERDIYNQKMTEFMEILEKLREENSRLERDYEENQIIHARSLSAKDGEIIELQEKRNFSETLSENAQDYSILKGLKQDLSEIFLHFKDEQLNNAKFVAQMDKIASLQNELNKFRLKEIENRNKLIDEYEEKIVNLKDENDNVAKELAELKVMKQIGIPDDSEREYMKSRVFLLEEEVKRYNDAIIVLNESLSKRDEQVKSQYDVIEVQKKQFENMSFNLDDIESEIHRLKIEVVQLKDDNDILIGLMGYSLEILKKKRNIQAINLSQVQCEANRNRVIKIFKRFEIPFEL